MFNKNLKFKDLLIIVVLSIVYVAITVFSSGVNFYDCLTPFSRIWDLTTAVCLIAFIAIIFTFILKVIFSNNDKK
jgi:uncharacterized membrane protein